jgi:NTE family protein
VSNTPLQHLLEEEDNKNTLVFQVDLFSARGELPRSMAEVASRQKDIQYSSRTRMTTDVYKRLLGWKKQAYRLLRNTPDENLTPEERRMRDDLAKLPEITILQMIYQQKHYEGDAKDYEFSGTSMREHWKSGYDDTKRALNNRRFLEMPPEGTGIVTHDIHRDAEY